MFSKILSSMMKSVVICYLILLCDIVLCHGGHEEKGSSAGTSACDDGKVRSIFYENTTELQSNLKSGHGRTKNTK